MPRIVEPRVFLIAETETNWETAANYPQGSRFDVSTGLQGFLNSLGVPEWRTKAESPAEELIEVAGKTCYLSFSTDLNKNLTKVGMRSNGEYVENLVKQRHGSVLEHATLTFAFKDVSRVFTHELVRHRVGTAYSQVSGRYVRTDSIDYWMPKEIRENPVASKIFEKAFHYQEACICELEEVFNIGPMKDFTLKKKLTSAFRRLIGNGQANHIIVSFNHRTLRHLIELRTSRHAEEEIRLVFNKVFDIVKDRYPAIYTGWAVEEVDGLNEVTFAESKV